MRYHSSKRLAALVSVVGLASNAARAVSVPFVKSSKAASGDDEFHFQNNQDTIYIGTIKVLGKDFEVQIDTGSSDLWLDTTGVDISSLIHTGQLTNVTYGDGTVAAGPIVVGNVTFGDFTFSTAFISAPGSNATTLGDTGLLGVGPPGNSEIRSQLQGSTFSGDTVLENVFASNQSLPKFITFELSRSEVTSLTSGGVFTLGETNSNFSTILNAPQLPALTPDAWFVPMDGMNVNGKPIPSQDKDIALLDTGTSLAQLPKAYIDAIYGSVPGAVFDPTEGQYTIPCDTKLNISFSFGGIAYPVHPIDVVTASTDDSGHIICTSGFQVNSPDDGPSGGGVQSSILGDSFLRGVYSLFAYSPETTPVNGTPAAYAQLLSTINIDQAFAEFDTLSAQRNASLLSNSTSGNGNSGNGTSTGGGKPNAANPSLSTPMGALVTTSILSVLGAGLGMLLI